jgi:hypothetical protein
MKTERLTNSPSFKASLRINSITKAIAISGLAMGVAVSIPAAPAGAVSFNSSNNQSSRLTFGNNNGDFGQNVTGLAGNNFSVTFNTTPPGSIPNQVSNVQGAFSPTFVPGSTLLTNNSPVANFSYQSGNLNSSLYQLTNDILFQFSNNVSYTFKAGSLFQGSDPTGTNAISFQLAPTATQTSFFTSGSDITNATTVAFAFGDTGAGLGGNYFITASPSTAPLTAVPEPFTVIGSLVGGAAALRMRKKLASATKK